MKRNLGYYCYNCDAKYSVWSGKCLSCGEWNTILPLEDVSESTISNSINGIVVKSLNSNGEGSIDSRFSSGFLGLDELFGGGIVNGSAILLGGSPGVGKSTLLAQILINVSREKRVLYCSGEESVMQVSQRFERLISEGNKSDNISITSEDNVESIVGYINEKKIEVLVIDSIQTVYSDKSRTMPGSIAQIKLAGNLLIKSAKKLGISIFIIGQITKSGEIAGPKLLEHLVDVVFMFEGKDNGIHRLLYCTKNRFGKTNDFAIFSMESGGLSEVKNPEKLFVGVESDIVGLATGTVRIGSRIMFVEVQALTVEKAVEGVPPRRVVDGYKKNRLDMLIAVIEKRLGIKLYNHDIYINIVGGLDLNDNSLDLAVCMAIISSVKNIIIDSKYASIGEVSLSGGVREVLGAEQFVSVATKNGYSKIVGNIKTKDKRVKKIAKLTDLVELF